MTQFSTIRLEIDDRGIATLTLWRPDKHNALNAVMMEELTEAANALSAMAQVRAVILAGEGASFCAGGDLGWMQETAAKDRAGKMAGSLTLAKMLKALDDLPKLLVAQVHGPAYGGGVGMMCVADVVIASETAKFALTETRLGLIPATIGPYVVRRLGEGAARQVFIHAPLITPTKALQIGLVSSVVATTDLNEAVEQEVAAALKCAPEAAAQAKSLAKSLARGAWNDPLQQTAGLLADRWESHEAKAGISAFFAKKRPPWAN